MHSILIISEDIISRERISAYLNDKKYQLKSIAVPDDALTLPDSFKPDVVIADIMSSKTEILQFIQDIRRCFDIEIIAIISPVIIESGSTGLQDELFNAGISDFIFKPFEREELDIRIRKSFREAALKKQNAGKLKFLKKLSITDELTGLYNSRHFFSQLKQEITRSTRYSRPLSLIMLDIDNFKFYNDSRGHLEGDKVLKSLGKLLKTSKRSMDTAYRYGGDEFAILLPETALCQACIADKRIKQNIGLLSFKSVQGTELCLSASTGAAELIKGETAQSLIHRADNALYKCKTDRA